MEPYSYVGNNPIMFTDPTVMEQDVIFIDENGKEIGNDGKTDGKVYLIKTTQTKFDSGVSSAGITADQAKDTSNFIKKNSGNTAAFQSNSIAYDNSIEIEGNSSNSQSMVDIVSGEGKDNGRGGTSDSNNREYGGLIGVNGVVSGLPNGPVVDPSKSIEVPFLFKFGDETKSTFHSHPSGFKEIGTKPSSNSLSFSNYTKYQFNQAPSSVDITNSKHSINYVFARGDKKVYMYNSSGVVGTLPMSRFVDFKK